MKRFLIIEDIEGEVVTNIEVTLVKKLPNHICLVEVKNHNPIYKIGTKIRCFEKQIKGGTK